MQKYEKPWVFACVINLNGGKSCTHTLAAATFDGRLYLSGQAPEGPSREGLGPGQVPRRYRKNMDFGHFEVPALTGNGSEMRQRTHTLTYALRYNTRGGDLSLSLASYSTVDKVTSRGWAPVWKRKVIYSPNGSPQDPRREYT